ncbi:MAG: hypothetical protein A2029_17180 [Chloroflexi bacterium RBG_19FT_COMBO_47_9]|nr:MAG: hypothetical protein A2029_17180 [Chloroflexi bacterium RBG_19FT_COMBO_47_9]
MSKAISGIIAPITTPFSDDEVNLEFLKENINKYSQTNLSGYLILGSNGENSCLNDVERHLIIQTIVNAKSSTQKAIVGISSDSTRVSIERTNQAADLGADYVSLLTPYYFKSRLSNEALINYFVDVAEKSKLPVFIYNAPKFTGITLSIKVIEEISMHPNIIGMKDASPGSYMQYIGVCKPDFKIFAGSLDTLFPALILGAVGGVVSLANAFPVQCCRLYDLVLHGDTTEAKGLYMKLLQLNRSVSGSYSVAGVKYSMDIAGYHGGQPRLPLLPLTPDEKASIEKAIKQSKIFPQTN